MKGYVAQINGFTIFGSASEVQEQWDELKKCWGHLLKGSTLKFFSAEIYGETFTVKNTTPIKEVVFNG